MKYGLPKNYFGVSLILLFMFIMGGVIGCSANESDRSSMERSKHMLDERQYSQAIDDLEKKYQADPQNKSIALLLAQAHLGAAGIELFDFIGKVFGPQGPSEDLDLAIDPKCSKNELTKPQGFDFRCLAIRLLHRLPDPDNAHIERAKSILRQTFPNPAQTSVDVNFLAAFVELGSGFSRLKFLLKKTLIQDVKDEAALTPEQLPFDFMIHHLKRLFEELTQGIGRAKYSYGKINKYVVQYEGKPIIKIGNSSLTFSEDINLPTLLHFAISVLHEKSGSVDQELDMVVEKNTDNFGHGIFEIFHQIDKIHFSGQGSDTIEIMFHFETVINHLIEQLADLSEAPAGSHIDAFDIAYNHPPQILKNFGASAQQSWDEESSQPLVEYFASTKDQWDELNRLLSDWEHWVNDDLSKEQRDRITAYFADIAKNEGDFFAFPMERDEEHVKEWQGKVVQRLGQEMSAILMGQNPSIPPLSSDNVEVGFTLVQRTKTWIEQNLWLTR